MHRVSIGLPVYNGRHYLTQAIESILCQTYPYFELIISDNASNDGTSNICEEFGKKDKRIRYFKQNINVGASENYVFVLNQARGEYFMWSASDDYYEKTHLESLVHMLELNPDIAVVMSATKKINNDTGEVEIVRYNGTENPENLSAQRLVWRLARGDYYHLYIYGLFRTTILKRKFDGFEKVTAADRIFISVFAMSQSFGYVDKISYFRRVYTESSYKRYKDKDKKLSKIYESYRGYFYSIIIYFKAMLFDNDINMIKKLMVPIFAARYGFMILHSMVLRIVRR